MKIIEALKNLKLIEKRVNKNCQLLNQYAAFVSTDGPVFDSVEKQQAEVTSLIQANQDLATEYLRLKQAIENTNLVTNVTIGAKTYSISNLITLRRTVYSFKQKTYQMLNSANAVIRIKEVQRNPTDATNPPRIVMLYKEEDKNKAIREHEDFIASIDAKLEIVNAEVDLV